MDLTASALLDVQARLGELISGDNPTNYPRNVAIETARTLLREHNARVTPVLQGVPGRQQQKFVGQRVYWLKTGSLALDYNNDGTGLEPGCDVDAGAASESDEKIYTNNLYMQKVVETEDDLSDNLMEFTELAAERNQVAVLALRQALNLKTVNFLDANKTTVNTDTNLPVGITFNAGVFEVDPTKIDMKDWRGVTDLDTVMANNRIAEWFWMNGRYNFYNNYVDSRYRRRNDNERSEAAFDDMRMNFDIRALDSTLGGRNTFGVGKGTYVIWDRTDVSRVPTQVKDNMFEYFTEDPEMLINDNGTLRPLRYHVRLQRICTGTNIATMRMTFKYRWEYTLFGGLYPAPPSEDGHTGIAKFQTQEGG